MSTGLPLEEKSIRELYLCNSEVKYVIPLYQRNYSWEKIQIRTLLQDVYDSFQKEPLKVYYLGTLVTFSKETYTYEVIDGQQRLTTILLVLSVLRTISFDEVKSRLSYIARKRAEETIQSLGGRIIDKDKAISMGHEYAVKAYADIVKDNDRTNFDKYFLDKVHIIHYHIPVGLDLNHYFEVMNSRGEQLEQHEIVKARLYAEIDDSYKSEFSQIWEACSNMGTYIQYRIKSLNIDKAQEYFGKSYDTINESNVMNKIGSLETKSNRISIKDIIDDGQKDIGTPGGGSDPDDAKTYRFTPIIDFPNFLLMVLKITRMDENDFKPSEVPLDDKILLESFETFVDAHKDDCSDSIIRFSKNMLLAKFLLDNYVIHTDIDSDVTGDPWLLKRANLNGSDLALKDTYDDQKELVKLLSMFEVTYQENVHKNYLLYCLLFLKDNLKEGVIEEISYVKFLRDMASAYFHELYLSGGVADDVMLNNRKLRSFTEKAIESKNKDDFKTAYDSKLNGTDRDFKQIPEYIFNYTDYVIWSTFEGNINGTTENSDESIKLFGDKFGSPIIPYSCFRNHYFSSTRDSLEHYCPQEFVENGSANYEDVNCFGNYAYINRDKNSDARDAAPEYKLNKYWQDMKNPPIQSVGSLKFMLMMRVCADNNEWKQAQIRAHQIKMLELLFP